MRLFFQANFLAVFIVMTVKGDGSSSSCPKPYDKMMLCNLMCNLLQDSSANDAIKLLQAKLESLVAVMNKPAITTVIPASSCKKQYEKHNSTKSQVYTLKFGSQKIPVYCHMGNVGCGDGGWTLAMKINGAKKTFHYSSGFWSNKNPYNLPGGTTGFDDQETKLPTYWNTSNKKAASLHSLIADGKYRSTSLDGNTWKKLIGSQASLQTGCNKEGFNAASSRDYSKTRIGILANDQRDCHTCDSKIGFGNGGQTDDSNTCGNNAIKGYTSDNGGRSIKAMGYILVQ